MRVDADLIGRLGVKLAQTLSEIPHDVETARTDDAGTVNRVVVARIVEEIDTWGPPSLRIPDAYPSTSTLPAIVEPMTIRCEPAIRAPVS